MWRHYSQLLRSLQLALAVVSTTENQPSLVCDQQPTYPSSNYVWPTCSRVLCVLDNTVIFCIVPCAKACYKPNTLQIPTHVLQKLRHTVIDTHFFWRNPFVFHPTATSRVTRLWSSIALSSVRDITLNWNYRPSVFHYECNVRRGL